MRGRELTMKLLMNFFQTIHDNAMMHQTVVSALLIAGVLLMRWLLLSRVMSAPIKSADLRRRWIVQIRNMCFLVVAVGLIIIWAQELRALALSVVAVLVAIVLATKELILCVTGGFLKITAGAFALGDRIEVNHLRGDVIDQTLLTNKILEIGPGSSLHQGTSRAITIPNSVFLTSPVINESFTEPYVLHTFSVPIKAGGPWQRAEKALLDASDEVCRPFLSDARRHIAHLTAKEGFDTPSVDPRVSLSLPNPEQIDLVVRVPAPNQRKGFVEQEILRRYLRNMESNDGEVSP